MLRFDDTYAQPFLHSGELDRLEPQVLLAHRMLEERTAAGSDYLGWLDLPVTYDKEEYRRLREAARRVREQSDTVVVIGIGGSYLGTRAAVDMMRPPFSASQPEIVFCGQNLSPEYMAGLLDWLETREVSVNVVSKSGTTTEPAVAFRFLRAFMERKYGKEGARARIVATTDRSRGALKTLADEVGYETFVIPDDVGGRYSVLTPVGLLPIEAAGIDTQAMLDGAAEARDVCRKPSLAVNPAYRYAAVRNALLRSGIQTELLVGYDPSLHTTAEWWKQLFGESEGKDGRGLFPASVDNTTDLHSMGQYIQEGARILMETVLEIQEAMHPCAVPASPDDADGLNYLEGRDLHDINRTARLATQLAHVDGGVPNVRVELPERSAYAFGQMVYFFEKACAVSGSLLAINPFDQPGVEAYKKNMFALLGRPGHEDRRAELEKRIRS